MNESVPQAEDTPAPDANAEELAPLAAESSTAEDTTDETKKPSDGGFQRRISELTRNYRETERERDYLRAERERDRQELERLRQPKTETPATGKKLQDFNYDEGQYQAYLFEQAETRAVAAAERRLKEEADRTTAQRRQSEFSRREEKFAKDLEDYHEVTRSSSLPITPAMSEVIAESDDGPALAYYLGKNLSIAENISRLSPLAAARELGRIEQKLSHERDAAKKPPVSKAPPPPPKIEGAGEGTTRVSPDDPESDKLDSDAWARARNKQLDRRKTK